MLDKIIEHKREEIKNLKPFMGNRIRPVHDVTIFLKEKPFITEVKQASPTLGHIKTVDPVVQAQTYADAGAGAISVLTDEKFFSGSLNYLHDVAHNVALPVLCKDFILCEQQVENAFAAGADLILLMATVLSETELKTLSQKAYKLGLNVLFEVHTMEEYNKLQQVDVQLLGVNSRNLKNLTIDKAYGAELLKNINGNFIKVAESGIDSPEDITNFHNVGANAYLIGSYLMKSESVETAMKELYGGLPCS